MKFFNRKQTHEDFLKELKSNREERDEIKRILRKGLWSVKVITEPFWEFDAINYLERNLEQLEEAKEYLQLLIKLEIKIRNSENCL